MDAGGCEQCHLKIVVIVEPPNVNAIPNRGPDGRTPVAKAHLPVAIRGRKRHTVDTVRWGAQQILCDRGWRAFASSSAERRTVVHGGPVLPAGEVATLHEHATGANFADHGKAAGQARGAQFSEELGQPAAESYGFYASCRF
jgi:hypothetical protein